MSAPFVQDAYYIPLDPDFYYSDLYMETKDASSDKFLYASPYYVVKEGHEVEAHLPGVSEAVLTTTGNELHLGQTPPHWFGKFANSETEVSIEPALTRYASLFLYQGADRHPYDEVPYTLYQDGSVVTSGNLLAASDFWDWMDSTAIPLSSTGVYSLEITYDQYWVNSQPGRARVIADFDTGQTDKDPPTLLALNVFYNGETASLVPSLAASEVRFRVQDPGGLSQVSLFYHNDGDWTPVSLTSVGDEYTAQLPGFANGVLVSLKIMAQDTAGNSLTYEVVPTFSVGVPLPVPVSPPDGSVTQDHDVTFAWETVPEATGYRIQIDTTRAFTSANLISDTVTGTSCTGTLSLGTWYWRVLAVDGEGNESAYFPPRRVTVAEPVVQVTTDTGSEYDPAIMQASNGVLWVVWYSYRSGNADIWYKTSTDSGTTWSVATQLTTDTSSDYAPAIIQTADGTLWVVWYSHRSSNADIWYKTSIDSGATWSAATQLATDTSNDYRPAIAQAADGTLWVVWYSHRSVNADIWYKTSPDGGATWSAAVQLTTSTKADCDPTVAQAADGTIWIVWCRNGVLWYRTSSDGGDTLSAEAQVDGNWCCYYSLSLIVAGDGVMWLASQRDDDVWYQTSSNNGTTWSVAQQWTRFVDYDDDPNLAALSGNRVGLVWQSNRSGNDDVWFGIFGQREDVNPPPYISSVEHTPSPNPDSNDVVTFRAYAQDETEVANVHLVWERDGLPQPNAVMYDDSAHDDYATGDGWYGVQIGPFPVGTEIAYQVRAVDSDGNSVTWPMTPKSFTVLEPFTKTADILFVPDYGGNSTGWFQPYFTNALDDLGYAYDVWDTGLRAAPGSGTLNLYTDDVVIWVIPYRGYFDDSDVRPDIEAYLDAGGKLFMTGQNVAQYLNGRTLLNDYLHATYVQYDTNLYALIGTAGDPIGNGLALGISGGDGANNQYDTDEIDPIGPAVTVFTYDTGATMALLEAEAELEASLAGIISSGTAGLRVDTGTYKVVYFAFGFEGINSANDRATVMGRVLAWLQELVPPMASFTSSSPDWLGQGMVFTNTTVVTGPVSCLWDLGDGVTNTLESPIHTYTNPGVYTVVLTATNFVGSDVATGTVTVHGPPDAAFISSSPDWLGQTTFFTNTTAGQGPITHIWCFGDGVTSTMESPTHTYSVPGTCTVVLTATNPAGNNVATDTVTVHGPPDAAFTTSSPDWLGQITFFTNTTTGQGSITYTWDFGDGITSTQESPTHTYANSGVRIVVLTATNPAGSDVATDTVTVYGPPTADFIAHPTQGIRPLTVAFTDTTTTIPPDDPTLIYLWRFGDGETSTLPNPTHTYTEAGVYTVTLTAGNAAGSDTVTRTHLITVNPVPVQADFTAAPTSGVAPLMVVFTNTSTGDYTIRQWDFGDGVTSALESPTHTYTAAGAYTVTLTVSGPGGTDTVTRTNYITVYAPVQADFTAAPIFGVAPLMVAFTNTSSGDYTISLWDFGDGVTGTLESPTHTYTAAGAYTVTLTVSGPSVTDALTRTNYITIVEGTQITIDPTTGNTLVYTDIQGLTTTVQVPAGAVTETTLLIYTPVETATAPSGLAFAGHAFDLGAYRGGSLLPSLTFSVPVTVTLHYTDTNVAGLDEDALVLEYWNGGTDAWEDAACGPYERHPDDNWLAAPICHLSRFALFGEAAGGKYAVYLPLLLKNW